MGENRLLLSEPKAMTGRRESSRAVAAAGSGEVFPCLPQHCPAPWARERDKTFLQLSPLVPRN